MDTGDVALKRREALFLGFLGPSPLNSAQFHAGEMESEGSKGVPLFCGTYFPCMAHPSHRSAELYFELRGRRHIFTIEDMTGTHSVTSVSHLIPNAGQKLKSMLLKNPKAAATFPHESFDPRSHKSKENLSDFSSRGPTRDFRIKPEVVAPGEYIMSAKSDGNTNTHNCALEDQMGTSMATPFVASVGVQLQQYFRDGYYPQVLT